MSLNGADGMANRVDPDQTAPVCPGISVRNLRIITVDPDQTAHSFWLICLFVVFFPGNFIQNQ